MRFKNITRLRIRHSCHLWSVSKCPKNLTLSSCYCSFKIKGLLSKQSLPMKKTVWYWFSLFMFFLAFFFIGGLGSKKKRLRTYEIRKAGHRYRGRCHRHRHSGILYLSSVPDPPSTFLFITILNDWMPDSQTFWHLNKGYTLHGHTVDCGNVQIPTPYSCWCRNAGETKFLPVVSSLSPALAFRHQSSVRYRWSRNSPKLPGYGNTVQGTLGDDKREINVRNISI